MSEIDYHKRHEAYIGAVAEALEKAGFKAQYWFADANDPRDGAIELDLAQQPTVDGRPAWTDDEVAVCWQEERGWYIVSGRGSKFVYELGVETVAGPGGVVLAVAAKAGLTVEVTDDGHPDVDFPEHEFDDDDPAFEEALLHYFEPVA